jgi:hypothetical protein
MLKWMLKCHNKIWLLQVGKWLCRFVEIKVSSGVTGKIRHWTISTRLRQEFPGPSARIESSAFLLYALGSHPAIYAAHIQVRVESLLTFYTRRWWRSVCRQSYNLLTQVYFMVPRVGVRQ